jgi:hypothetical protein
MLGESAMPDPETDGQRSESRRTYTFYVDDAVLDRYGPRLGVYGIAVYVYLVRRAKQRRAFPSYKTIGAALGISRDKALKTVHMLVELGLVSITRRTSAAGDPDSNLYEITDLSPLRRGSQQLPGSSCKLLPGSHELPQVVVEDDHGSTPQRPPYARALPSLKGSQLKEENPPNPPDGCAGEHGSAVALAGRPVPLLYEPLSPGEGQGTAVDGHATPIPTARSPDSPGRTTTRPAPSWGQHVDRHAAACRLCDAHGLVDILMPGLRDGELVPSTVKCPHNAARLTALCLAKGYALRRPEVDVCETPTPHPP